MTGNELTLNAREHVLSFYEGNSRQELVNDLRRVDLVGSTYERALRLVDAGMFEAYIPNIEKFLGAIGQYRSFYNNHQDVMWSFYRDLIAETISGLMCERHIHFY